MENFTPFSSLLGGLLVGASATLVLATQGRIAGVSGMCSAALRPGVEGASWRLSFLVGLVGVGLLLSPFWPAHFSTAAVPSLGYAAVGGLLVGFGTRLGNGCTSGHGVCGISRLSRRSIAATLTFMFTGGVTVYVVRHVIGVGG